MFDRVNDYYTGSTKRYDGRFRYQGYYIDDVCFYDLLFGDEEMNEFIYSMAYDPDYMDE